MARTAVFLTAPDLRFATVAVISPDVFVDSVDLSEAAINAYYEDNADAWQEQEKRLISQMIFADAARAENAISRINGARALPMWLRICSGFLPMMSALVT